MSRTGLIDKLKIRFAETPADSDTAAENIGGDIYDEADNTAIPDPLIVDVLKAKQIYTDSPADINDDSVLIITPHDNIGALLINARNDAYKDASCLAIYRALATSFMEILAQPGIDVQTSTAILTGTTGADGRMTISANDNGNIYIENRLGLTISIAYTILGS